MNKLIVKKFGGTSVANAERIEAVADLVAKSVEEGNEVVVVLSAMGKSTDELIKLSKDINPNPDLREYDALVSTGEQISVALLAMALQKRNIKGKSFTAYQLESGQIQCIVVLVYWMFRLKKLKMKFRMK